MARNKHKFTTAIFEDGTCAVLRTEPTKPNLMEVIATFYDAAHAREYVRTQNARADEHQEERPVIKQVSPAKPKQASKVKPAQASAAKLRPARAAKPKQAPEAAPKNVDTGLTERQTAVLKTLRSMMDKKHRVEVKAAELVKASSIPLGSLHSVLASLEKKQMIRTERQGSPKFPAIYEVLETSRTSARSLNGVVHGQEARAATTAH